MSKKQRAGTQQEMQQERQQETQVIQDIRH